MSLYFGICPLMDEWIVKMCIYTQWCIIQPYNRKNLGIYYNVDRSKS